MTANTLADIATADGRFAILAIDQRGTLKKMLDKYSLPSEPADMTAFKVELVKALSPAASGVLIDTEFGSTAVREAGALAPTAGLLISAEQSPAPTIGDGESRVLFDQARGPEWVRANGGSALKYLVRWNPDRPADMPPMDLKAEALATIAEVVEVCRAGQMPSVIEPLVFALPGQEKLAGQAHYDMVIKSAIELAPLGMDMLKLEWPGDAAGCKRVSDELGNVPWALLSAGVEFEDFVERVKIALDNGACGYIAGRAIWGEAASLTGADRTKFFNEVAVPRGEKLAKVLEGRGRTWTEVAG